MFRRVGFWRYFKLDLAFASQIGSYFGYSVTVLDANGDGLDDVAVGAPWYTDPAASTDFEEGSVSVYTQTQQVSESLTYFPSRFCHVFLYQIASLCSQCACDFCVCVCVLVLTVSSLFLSAA